MGTDAKVRIGVEGGEEVARAAERVIRPWITATETARNSVQGMGKAVTDTFQSVASDVARGVTAFAAFDFASRIPAVITYREEVARLSVVAGSSSEELRARFAAQEASTLSARGENEKFAQSFGRLTYGYRDATEAAAALGTEALAANRSIGEMAGAGKIIYDVTGSIKNAPEVLGRLRAQAEALKTVGGPDALRDQFESLGGVISRLAAQSPEQLGKLTATLGALGKGLRPDQQKEVQQTVIGQILGDTMKTERFLRSQGELKAGESILDASGQVKDLPGLVEKYQRAWRHGAGSEQEARRLARLHFGDLGGAAFLNMDSDAARAAAGLAPSTEAEERATQLRNSDDGRRKAAELAARGAQSDIAAKALPAVDAVLGFAGAHPIAAGVGALMGPGLASKGIGAAADALRGALEGGGAAITRGGVAAGAAMAAGGRMGGISIAGASSGLLAKLGLLGAAGAAGYAVGTYVDDKLGASDTLSGTSAAHLMLRKFEDDEAVRAGTTSTVDKLQAGKAAKYGEVIGNFKRLGKDKFAETYGQTMMREGQSDPAMLRLFEGLENGKLDKQGLSNTTMAALTDALSKAQINVTISNSSSVPSDQLKAQGATNNQGHQ